MTLFAASICETGASRRRSMSSSLPQPQHVSHNKLTLQQRLCQRLSLHEFGGNEALAFTLADLVDSHDVRMIQSRRRTRLPLESPRAFGVLLKLGRQQLQRYRPVKLHVLGEIHLAHRSPAYLADDTKVPQYAAVQGFLRKRLSRFASQGAGGQRAAPTLCGKQ